MKKEYIVYKLSECAKQACRIDNSLFTSFNVKRGLRNEDGTGVLVGLTKIGNVVGYEKTEEGLKPIPGKLFYRGYDLDDIVHALLKEKRFGFEEVAYLLLSGELPDKEQLASFKELINDNMPLDKKTTMNIIDLEAVVFWKCTHSTLIRMTSLATILCVSLSNLSQSSQQ